MAEVSIDSLTTSKTDDLDEGSVIRVSAGVGDSLTNGSSTDARPRRRSLGSNHAGGSSLRSSAEKSESANSSHSAVPHYLRASTGSCHDFCKFGREHSVETKVRKPIRKKIGKPSPWELSPIQILVSGGKKKEEVVSGGKEEEVVSGGKKEEEEVMGGKTKEENVSGGNTKELVSAGKKEEVVLGGKKKGDIVSISQKERKVVSGSRKKAEVVSIGEKKEEAVDHGTPTDTKGHSAHKKPSPDTKSRLAKLETSSDKAKASLHKSSTYTNNHSPNVTSSHNKLSSSTKTDSSKRKDSSGNKTLSVKREPSSAKKSPSADPPEIVKSVVFPYTEVRDSVKRDSSADNKISRTVKKTATLPKQLSIPVKLKSVKIKPASSSDDSDGKHGNGRRNSNAEIGGKLMASKASAKKIFTSPTLTSKLSLKKTAENKSRKPGSLKTVSSPKDQSGIRRVSTNKASNNKKVSEKTLHVISMETGNDLSNCISGENAIPSSPPSPSSAKPSTYEKSTSLSSHEDDISESEESDVEADEVIPENNASMETSNEPAVKEINSKTVRKIRVAVSEVKPVSPVKVKFRMGKVVDLQSDNNTPRKLRFRRARVLGADDNKGDSRRKTSRKAGINGDAAATGDSSEKVILKHQDVQGKKDAQGLLNNVIEETASKLAVSRKSKVKALVGAFETVISLQEIKPSTQVVS